MAKRKGLTKKQRTTAIKEFNYRDRVKRMRGIFGEQFKAKDGYDLRKFNSWSPAQKAKVTKYFRVIAPRISGDFVKKRYRRPDNLQAAIGASLQEEFLPGQTAAVFSKDPTEKLAVTVRNGRAQVRRNNMEQDKLIFDRAALLDDPDAELDRVLQLTNANVFQIIVGAQKQNRVLTRSQLIDEIVRLMNAYSVDEIDDTERPAEEWLNGLIAYQGTVSKVQPKLERMVEKHQALANERRREHDRDRSKRRRAHTVQEILRGKKK